ncbi:MAG: hypothetical protein GVY19_09305 [Bacteroidetes bacterium]|jgi:hypothetical protein|nr:hypothetical protein [Bacteroidota bacterium]
MNVKTIFILLLLVISFSCSKNQHDWENPVIFSKNKEMPHATLIPYNNEKGALEMKRDSSPFFCY